MFGCNNLVCIGILVLTRLLNIICAGDTFNPGIGIFRYSKRAIFISIFSCLLFINNFLAVCTARSAKPLLRRIWIRSNGLAERAISEKIVDNLVN